MRMSCPLGFHQCQLRQFGPCQSLYLPVYCSSCSRRGPGKCPNYFTCNSRVGICSSQRNFTSRSLHVGTRVGRHHIARRDIFAHNPAATVERVRQLRAGQECRAMDRGVSERTLGHGTPRCTSNGGIQGRKNFGTVLVRLSVVVARRCLSVLVGQFHVYLLARSGVLLDISTAVSLWCSSGFVAD